MPGSLLKSRGRSASEPGAPRFSTARLRASEVSMYWANLSIEYSNIGASVLSVESTTKARQLRDRASDREKFFIDFLYDRQVTGNLEKAYQSLELWLQTYPRGDEPPSPHDLLGGF